MKVAQLRQLMREMAKQKEAAGDTALADGLTRFAAALSVKDKESVQSLATLLKSLPFTPPS